MTDKERVLTYLATNNGVVSAKEVRQMRIDTKVLQRLTQDGDLERIAHGLYMDIDHLSDPFFVAQYRCPQGVYSMDTALYLHHLTDRNPTRFSLTIPSGSNTRFLVEPEHYRFFYLKEEIWLLGQTTVLSPYGNSIIIYDVERTLCECIRKLDEMDREEVISAVKSYMKAPGAKFSKLLDYAEIFHIREKVRQYMEVLR